MARKVQTWGSKLKMGFEPQRQTLELPADVVAALLDHCGPGNDEDDDEGLGDDDDDDDVNVGAGKPPRGLVTALALALGLEPRSRGKSRIKNGFELLTEMKASSEKEKEGPVGEDGSEESGDGSVDGEAWMSRLRGRPEQEANEGRGSKEYKNLYRDVEGAQKSLFVFGAGDEERTKHEADLPEPYHGISLQGLAR